MGMVLLFPSSLKKLSMGIVLLFPLRLKKLCMNNKKDHVTRVTVGSCLKNGSIDR
jgi:hypothetical protein